MVRRKNEDETATTEDMEALITEFCEWIEDGTLDFYLEPIDLALENRNTRFRTEQRKERSKSHAELAKRVSGTKTRIPSVKRSEEVSESVARTRTRKPTADVPEVEPTGNDFNPGDLFYITGDKYWAMVAKFVKLNEAGKAVMVVDEKTPEDLQDRFPVGKRFTIPVKLLEPKPVRGRPRRVKDE